MRGPIRIALALLVAASSGCEEPAATRYKRSMREIERAHVALSEGLKPENARDAASTRTALEGQAARIAHVMARPEVAEFREEEDFRNFAAICREEAAKLEEAISAGRIEEAQNQLLAVDAACTFCHNAYREEGG